MRPRHALLLTTIALAMGLPVAAQEPILLTEDAGGILELQGERRIEIVGLRGSLGLRQGNEGEIRFAARDPSDRSKKLPVALWLDGKVLRLTAVAGAEDVPVRLEVAVSPELDTRIEAVDSEVSLASLHGTIRVTGERLALTGRALDASLELDIDEGSVKIVRVSQDVTLEGRGLEAQLEGVKGPISLALEGGTLRLNHIDGEIDGELEETDFTASNVKQRVRLGASGGSVGLNVAEGGAQLRMFGAPVTLAQTKGLIELETDAEVRFDGHEGQLTIRSRGASVYGKRASGGSLEIRTDHAEVKIEDFESETAIHGDNLRVRAAQCRGALSVFAVYSTIVIEEAEKAVEVENEFGDIEVTGASNLVRISSKDGDVRLDQLKGSVQVMAAGAEVSVTWASLQGSERSAVENTAGDVRVQLPGDARCRIDAQAPHGRVETDLEGVTVSDDGHSASGLLLGGRGRATYVKQPALRLRSAGNLHLYNSGAPGSGN